MTETEVIRLGNRFVNWWLVMRHDGAVLIDAGLPRQYNQLLDKLQASGIDPAMITACLLTHADIDHIGVAPRLARDHDVEVFLHAGEEDAARGEGRELPQEILENLWRPYVAETAEAYGRDGALEPEFLSTFSPLEAGSELDLPGRPRVVHCPGHTPGSCAFYFPEDDLLFSGDALISVDIFTGEPGPQLLPTFDNHDYEQALRSLDELDATGAHRTFTGHGDPIYEEIGVALGEARRRAA